MTEAGRLQQQHYAEALDLCADALMTLQPQEFQARAPKIMAIIRNAAESLRQQQRALAEAQQQLVAALNDAIRLVDEERRRWYAALEGAGLLKDLEGLAPEAVAKHLAARVANLESAVAEGVALGAIADEIARESENR